MSPYHEAWKNKVVAALTTDNNQGRTAMHIKVALVSVYGVTVARPANDAAHLVAGIANKKTLTPDDLARAARLGHTVQFDGTHEDAFDWNNKLAAASNRIGAGARV